MIIIKIFTKKNYNYIVYKKKNTPDPIFYRKELAVEIRSNYSTRQKKIFIQILNSKYIILKFLHSEPNKISLYRLPNTLPLT